MATHLTTADLIPFLLPIMVLLVLYRRIRRNVGRQEFKLRRLILRLVVFSVFTLVIAALSLDLPSSLAGLGGGILLGVPLGLLGLRLTRFETTDEGHFYRPNTYIGVAISLVLVGRLAHRLTELHAASLDASHHAPSLLQSPLTLFILGVLAGYYIFYNINLLVLHRRMGLELEDASQ